jgi:hypothetical protein
MSSVDDMPIPEIAEIVHGPAPIYGAYMGVVNKKPWKGTNVPLLFSVDDTQWRSEAVRTRPNFSSIRLRESLVDYFAEWGLMEPIEFTESGVPSVVFLVGPVPRFTFRLETLKNEGVAKTYLANYFAQAISLGTNPNNLPAGVPMILPSGFTVSVEYEKGKKMREQGRVYKGGRVTNNKLMRCTHEWPVDLPVE